MSTRDSDIPAGAIELRSTSKLRDHPSAGLVPEIRPEDYRSLRADIERRGLQEPLEITAEDVVLNGHLRLRAARELRPRLGAGANRRSSGRGRTHAACRPANIATCRPSQRAALVVELDQYREERDEARERRLANLRQNTEVANLPPRGKTRELAARWAGGSPRRRPIRRHRPRARPRPVRQGQSRRTRC